MMQIPREDRDDPDFFIDLVEGTTNVLELIGQLDASISEDAALVEGVKAMIEKLQNRNRATENRIELKRGLLAHALEQLGLKTYSNFSFVQTKDYKDYSKQKFWEHPF